jgi:hypothetical protein
MANLNKLREQQKKDSAPSNDEVMEELAIASANGNRLGTGHPTKVEQLSKQVDELEATLSSSIVPSSEGVWHFLGFQMTPTQLIAPETFTDAEFEALGYVLKGMDKAVQFWFGDWANLCVRPEFDQYQAAEEYNKLADQFGIRKETLKDYAWVCRQINASLRKDALPFSHHKEVAGLPDLLKGREAEFLDWAESNRASVVDLRKYISEMLIESADKKQNIASESFLFSKDRMPKIGNVFQNRWTKARNGDKNAKSLVLDELTQIRKWADEIEESLED